MDGGTSTSLPDIIPVSVGTLRSFVEDILHDNEKRKDQNHGPYPTESNTGRETKKDKAFSLTKELKNTVKYDFLKIIIASLLFVTALSWNDTFKEFFQSIEALKKAKLWVYSLTITAITLVVSRMYSLYVKKSE